MYNVNLVNVCGLITLPGCTYGQNLQANPTTWFRRGYMCVALLAEQGGGINHKSKCDELSVQIQKDFWYFSQFTPSLKFHITLHGDE